MDKRDISILKKLRRMEGKDAAAWLIENCPINSPANSFGTLNASLYISHMSWKAQEQKSLAEYYLSNLPHANESIYSAFLKVMSVDNFIASIEKHIPNEDARKSLLFYYLIPVLCKASTNAKDQAVIDDFLTRQNAHSYLA